MTCSQCDNRLTVADAPPLCGQCRRGRFGGREPKRRVATKYEREQRAIERKRGY